jgi:hypothetical protein
MPSRHRVAEGLILCTVPRATRHCRREASEVFLARGHHLHEVPHGNRRTFCV